MASEGELRAELMRALDLPRGARSTADYRVAPGLTVDYRFIGNGKTHFVAVRRLATVESLSLLLFAREMSGDNNTSLHLAARSVPPGVSTLAEKAGVDVIVLGRGAEVPDARHLASGLTHEKAWRTVVKLLELRKASVRRISVQAGISYGWAHSVVSRLIDAGIAVRDGQSVRFADPGALLDQVTFERPFPGRQLTRFSVTFVNSQEAAVTMTRSCDAWREPVAFTAFTSATLQSGYSVRSDVAFAYVRDKASASSLQKEFSGKGETSVTLVQPDRDVFSRSSVVAGVRVVPLELTLLDLLGLGFQASDASMDMVNRYGELTGNPG